MDGSCAFLDIRRWLLEVLEEQCLWYAFGPRIHYLIAILYIIHWFLFEVDFYVLALSFFIFSIFFVLYLILWVLYLWHALEYWLHGSAVYFCTARKYSLYLPLKCVLLICLYFNVFFAAGGDFTFFFGSFHFEEIASKTWYHTVSSHTLKELEVSVWWNGILKNGLYASIHFGDAIAYHTKTRQGIAIVEFLLYWSLQANFMGCKMSIVHGRRPWMCWKIMTF
jgi:hypothetical protein